MPKTKLFFNVIVILTLVLVSLGNRSMVAQAGQKYEPKADPRLLQMATDHPNATFKIIIQKRIRRMRRTRDKDDDPQLAVRKGGGKVNKQMNLIKGFSGELTGKEIIKLAKNKKVRWISADVPLFSTSIPNSTALLKAPASENILDTFASIDFTGSDGSKNWSTPWIESDVDGSGAAIGNIQVFDGTNCWNSTGSCLQVITKNVGDNVSRTVDLSAATSATLSLWRNNQMTENTNNTAVTLDVSTDGSNWTTLRTWRDNNDDIGTASERFRPDILHQLCHTNPFQCRRAGI